MFVFVVEGDVHFYIACKVSAFGYEVVGCVTVGAYFFLDSFCNLCKSGAQEVYFDALLFEGSEGFFGAFCVGHLVDDLSDFC